ncbi:hypothetical protein EB118_02815 [bacterium]|nr:hypothetical protein [Actinomycetota bacterium]NDG29015.1 hypothetical protein [bacterium]
MSQAIILKTFFHQLVEVVDQLVEMFPGDQNFKIFKTFLTMLQRSNPTLVISTFYEHVTKKYEKQIDARDEEFLTSYEPAEYGSDVTDILASVRPHWKSLSQESKGSLWQYIYILKELSKKYYV